MFSIAAMVGLSAVRNDRSQRLPAVRSIELVGCKFRRQSSSVSVFVREFLDESSSRNIL